MPVITDEHRAKLVTGYRQWIDSLTPAEHALWRASLATRRWRQRKPFKENVVEPADARLAEMVAEARPRFSRIHDDAECQGTAESPGRWTPDLHVGGHGMPMPAAV